MGRHTKLWPARAQKDQTSSGYRPREPRRRKTAGLVGAVGTPPGGRATAPQKIAQHHRLAVMRARIFWVSPTWSRTKRWKLLRLWRCRGAWASHGSRRGQDSRTEREPTRCPADGSCPCGELVRRGKVGLLDNQCGLESGGAPTVRCSGRGRLGYHHCRQRQEQRVLQSGRSPRCIRGRNLGALRSESYRRSPNDGPAAAEGV